MLGLSPDKDNARLKRRYLVIVGHTIPWFHKTKDDTTCHGNLYVTSSRLSYVLHTASPLFLRNSSQY